MTRTFVPGAIHRVTHKGRRVEAKYESPGTWHIAGIGYVAETDLQAIGPAIEPPVVHDVAIDLGARSLGWVARWGVGV